MDDVHQNLTGRNLFSEAPTKKWRGKVVSKGLKHTQGSDSKWMPPPLHQLVFGNWAKNLTGDFFQYLWAM